MFKNMGRFEYTRLIYTFQSEKDISKINCFENLIRGSLGFYLHQELCFCRKKTHDQDCLYGLIFEPTQMKEVKLSQGHLYLPRPFVQYARLGHSKFCKLEITLFGNAKKYIDPIHYCIEQMIAKGIGEEKLKFKVVSVFHNNEDIYVAEIKDLKRVEFGKIFSPKLDSTNLKITFETPCWLTNSGRPLLTFEIKPFLSTLISRLNNLSVIYQNQDHIFNDEILDDSSLASIQVEPNILYVDRARYSFRQEQKIPIGGFVGDVVLKNVPQALLPIIELGEICFVGKKTTLGNGKIFVETL